MAAQIGYWIGGFLIMYLVSALVLLAFGQKKYTYQAAFISTLIALAIATLLGAYGMADGAAPAFGAASTAYLVPAIAVLAVHLIRVNRKQAKSEKAADQ